MTALRTASRLLLVGVLAAAAAPAAAVVTPRVTAVVSVEPGGLTVALESAGVRVVSRQPHVSTAVVRGTGAELARLAGAPHVRGLAPDSELRPTATGSHVSTGSVFAWEQLGGSAGKTRAGAGVTVAVVDTGISDSSALSRSSGRLVDGVDTSGEDSFRDGYGHGTFMAGVLAGGPVPGSGSRGLGVAPGARVVSVKVADRTGTTSLSRVVAGLDWLVAHRDSHSIDVASFSFSRTRPGQGYGADPLTDAVERVHAAGVLVVVSAGNVRGEVGDPGFDPKVLTVGAADLRPPGRRPADDDGDDAARRARVADFSGSAVVAGLRKPDLVASGVGVLSVLPAGSVIARENPQARQDDVLWRGSGTSQATAVVAGAAALLLAARPAAAPTDVKASLRVAARRLDSDRAGAGLLRATTRLVAGSTPSDLPGGASGEVGFDANSWAANSWGANSWAANSWAANSWAANSWAANSWAARWDD